MRALVLTDQGPVFRTDYPVPDVAPGEALIRVACAGICSTDLELIKGYKGGFRGVLGHEFVGMVAAAPDAESWIGKRVVGEINVGCGLCDLCRRGLGKHCAKRTSTGIIGRDGVFADYLALPLANLHAVPEHLADAGAVFVEPLAAALRIVEQLHIGPDVTVYQLGDGRLGLLAAQVLARTGCDLTVIGRSVEKQALVAQLNSGRGVRIGTLEWDALQQTHADVVVDTTGSPQGFEFALQLVRPGGALVVKSTYAASLDAFNLSRLVVDELTLVGSRCGPFPPALRLLADGHIETRPLISAVYPLEHGVEGLHYAEESGVIKVLLTMDGSTSHG